MRRAYLSGAPMLAASRGVSPCTVGLIVMASVTVVLGASAAIIAVSQSSATETVVSDTYLNFNLFGSNVTGPNFDDLETCTNPALTTYMAPTTNMLTVSPSGTSVLVLSGIAQSNQFTWGASVVHASASAGAHFGPTLVMPVTNCTGLAEPLASSTINNQRVLMLSNYAAVSVVNFPDGIGDGFPNLAVFRTADQAQTWSLVEYAHNLALSNVHRFRSDLILVSYDVQGELGVLHFSYDLGQTWELAWWALATQGELFQSTITSCGSNVCLIAYVYDPNGSGHLVTFVRADKPLADRDFAFEEEHRIANVTDTTDFPAGAAFATHGERVAFVTTRDRPREPKVRVSHDGGLTWTLEMNVTSDSIANNTYVAGAAFVGDLLALLVYTGPDFADSNTRQFPLLIFLDDTTLATQGEYALSAPALALDTGSQLLSQYRGSPLEYNVNSKTLHVTYHTREGTHPARADDVVELTNIVVKVARLPQSAILSLF